MEEASVTVQIGIVARKLGNKRAREDMFGDKVP